MIAIIVKLALMFMVAGGAGLLAMRALVGATRQALGVGEDDPARKALNVATRIRGHLQSSKAGEMYGAVLVQLGELVSTRLPRLAETRDRLEKHFHDKPVGQLVQQVRQLEMELGAAKDPEIRALSEKNLRLAQERLQLHRQLELVHDRTVAQIKNALLTLEALEDRVASVQLLPAGQGVGNELESMLDDVGALETEYKRLQLLE